MLFSNENITDKKFEGSYGQERSGAEGWTGTTEIEWVGRDVRSDGVRIRRSQKQQGTSSISGLQIRDMVEKEPKLKANRVGRNEELICERDVTNGNDRKFWLEAMKEERSSSTGNEMWALVDRPKERKVLTNRWAFGIRGNTQNTKPEQWPEDLCKERGRLPTTFPLPKRDWTPTGRRWRSQQ